MGRMSVSLTPRAQRVVRQRVGSGEYSSAEQYLQQLVLRDEQRRRQRKSEALLLKRLDRTHAVEMDDADFAAIGRRIQRLVARRKSA